MLVFNNWMPLIGEFLKANKGRASASLISNLTVLDKQQIETLTQFNFSFGISLDGWSHSKPYKNGKSSAEIVRHNIDMLANYERVDISTVVNKKSLADIEKLAEWIVERNLNWGVYLDHYYGGELDTSYVANKLFNVIDILAAKNYDILNKFKFNNVKLLTDYDGCTAGHKLIAIDPDGFVHRCQTDVYNEPLCHITDFVPKEVDTYKLPDNCSKCPIKRYCHGGCRLNNRFGPTCDIVLLVFSYILEKQQNG